MFKWTIGLLLGCCSLYLLPTIPSTAWLISSFLIAIVLLWPKLRLKRYFNSYLPSALTIIISGILCGLVWTSTHAAWRLSEQISSPENNSAHIIEAEVSSLPVIYDEYCQFRIKVNQTATKQLLDRTLLVKDYTKPCVYRLGESWSLEVKLKPIYGPVNQAGFDYEFYLFEKAIDGKGYIRQGHSLSTAPSFGVQSLRQYLYDQLESFQHSGLLQALVIGEKSGIPVAQKEQLQQLGLSHLIAISGLHISIIAGLAFWLTFKLVGIIGIINRRVSWPPLKVALVTSCFAALIYSALADFSLPTVRALIMWCSVAACLLLQRNASFLAGLKWALLIILVVDPLSIFSVSFWMSFIAVTVISLVLLGRIGRDGGFRGTLKSIVKIQLAITLVLILPSLLFFQQASLLGFFLNILIIPLFSLIVLPAILLGLLLHLAFELSWLLQLIDSGIARFFDLAAIASETLELAQFKLFLPTWLILCLAIVALVLLLPLGQKLKYPFGVLLIMLLPIAVAGERPKSEPTLIVFDVGHGLAVLLTDGEHHLLYDTGYASAGSSAFKSYLLPSLQALNIHHLDALILSHQDNDHAGGRKAILEQLEVNQVIAGRWAIDKVGSLTLCEAGFEQTFGTFHLKALHPRSSHLGDNNHSCVIKVTSNHQDYPFSVLLTGDIEKDTEYRLAESLKQELKADILIAPHHGSNSSSTYPFIKMVNPEQVIYATERYSRYRLPHHKVMERYQNFGIQQRHTGCQGQITINLVNGTSDYQRERRHIWRKAECYLDKN